MPASEDHSEILKTASYAAYNEAVKIAYKILSDSIAEYFAEHRDLYNNEILNVPNNFRPLKDYERMLKIQGLTLRLALGTADLSEHKIANSAKLPIRTNGHSPLTCRTDDPEGPGASH
jgi:hypothetical protein